jgi:hypothetical protein
MSVGFGKLLVDALLEYIELRLQPEKVSYDAVEAELHVADERVDRMVHRGDGFFNAMVQGGERGLDRVESLRQGPRPIM